MEWGYEKERRVRDGNKVWGLAKRWMDALLPHTEIRKAVAEADLEGRDTNLSMFSLRNVSNSKRRC